MQIWEWIQQWPGSLGGLIVMPVGIFITALVFRIKPGKAFTNALQIGIGYFFLIILVGAISSYFGPLAQSLSTASGSSTSIPDIGVSIHFPIAFSVPAAALMIPLGMLVNFVLLKLKLTRTVSLDIWNYWTWLFSWGCVQGLTGNAFYGFIAFFITGALSLVLGDLQAKYIQEVYDLPGVSFPHAFSSFFGLLAWPFMWIFDLFKWKEDGAGAQKIQGMLGLLGNSIVIGFILGCVAAIAAGYSAIRVFETGVVTAAALFLVPEMLKHLSTGFFAASEAARGFLKEKFPDEDYLTGMDCAIGVTQPASIAVGMLLIPISILLAFFLPGNRVLPLADIAFLGFWVATPMAMFRNNILKGVIFGTFAIAASLWMATWISPLLTDLLVQHNSVAADTGLVSGLTVYPWAVATTWLFSFLK